MDADKIIQELAIEIYQKPLSLIRDEPEFPDLDNPLHLVVLLVDCDTEISMNGLLGFLENLTGQHLGKTIEALGVIGATRSAELFRSVELSMTKHGVTWARLRGDFEGLTECQITSFCELHGASLDSFSREICQLEAGFSLFNSHSSLEDAYGALCGYTQARVERLQNEIQKRKLSGTEG